MVASHPLDEYPSLVSVDPLTCAPSSSLISTVLVIKWSTFATKATQIMAILPKAVLLRPDNSLVCLCTLVERK